MMTVMILRNEKTCAPFSTNFPFLLWQWCPIHVSISAVMSLADVDTRENMQPRFYIQTQSSYIFLVRCERQSYQAHIQFFAPYPGW